MNQISTSAAVSEIHVPGTWECAKCEFTLLQKTMSAIDGSVCEADRPGGDCPNCATPMARLTWKKHAIALEPMVEKYFVQSRVLEEELITLKQLLLSPRAKSRQWYIGHLLRTQGHFRRNDIAETFGITFQQVSSDISKFMEANPGAAVFNKSSKRYEAVSTGEQHAHA